MKNKETILLLLGIFFRIVFTSIAFIMLIVVGSVSMANVEGIAEPSNETEILLILWLFCLLPYIIFLFSIYINRKDNIKTQAIKRSIIFSSNIPIIGLLIMFFLFDRSFIAGCLLAALIPVVQIVVTKIVYRKYLTEKNISAKIR